MNDVQHAVDTHVGANVVLELEGVSFYSFPRGVLTGTIPLKGCFQMWQRLREASAPIGKWPVLGDDELVRMTTERNFDDAAEILRSAAEIDIEEWFRKKRADFDENVEVFEEDDEDEGGDWATVHPELLSLELPPPLSDQAIGQAIESQQKGAADAVVRVFLLPTPHSWEAFAHIPHGYWNDCPRDEEHVAVLRHWYGQHGAELVWMNFDTIQLILPNGVVSLEAVCKLAEEQMVYCPDTVEQGTETITALAEGLQGSRLWFFWWD